MDTAIATLTEKLTCMSIEEVKFQKQVHELSKQVKVSVAKVKPFSWTNIQSDSKMRFYTGIQTIAIFNTLFSWIKPCLSSICFWRGRKRIVLFKYIKTRTQKVGGKDQFLLMLRRLRLGLLNEDLADRFCISASTCSSIFATWVKLISKVFGNALLIRLPRDTVYLNLPGMFKAKHNKTRCIIDCTEVYIERSKSLDVQAAIWSDYKKTQYHQVLDCYFPKQLHNVHLRWLWWGNI